MRSCRDAIGGAAYFHAIKYGVNMIFESFQKQRVTDLILGSANVYTRVDDYCIYLSRQVQKLIM